MRTALTLLAILAATSSAAPAQWTLENSNTTADLRGIHSIGGGVAWASGTNGTVLRTEDGGYLWQACTVPPGAEKLDFRGIQAFDANTAIVMSSGTGDLSRLYKTTDGCHSWKLIFTNPYAPDGFFDAILFIDREHGMVLSDPSPVNFNPAAEYSGDFHLRVTADGGGKWGPVSAPDLPGVLGNGLHPGKGEAAFAASNTSMATLDGWFWFATSASRIASRRLYTTAQPPQFFLQSMYCAGALDPFSGECGQPWIDFRNSTAPINHSSESAGIFSIHFRTALVGIVVGGDYTKPDEATLTGAYTSDGGTTWLPAQTPPHGYRSAVACDSTTKTWITVGPNGTDISTDDGKNWRALHPDPALHEAPDANRNWNALSLPFVVGPHGRIGKLDEAALKH
jgi:photosystem II stability/assembly factor-like uncharacterized protein